MFTMCQALFKAHNPSHPQIKPKKFMLLVSLTADEKNKGERG